VNQISKITGFYYLNYPDCNPPDVYNAGSETYVEAGDANSHENNFLLTFSVFVATAAFLASRVSDANKSFFLRNVIVVNRFDDSIIREALYRHLADLENFAERK
jgi:hypothetical protein